MKIIDIIQEEIHLLKEIKNLLKIEREILIKEDMDALLDIIEKKKGFMEMLDQLEQKRITIYPDMPLREFEKDENIKDEIQRLGKDLRNIVDEIQQYQETNQILTEQSIIYGQKIISIIHKAGKRDSSTYGANGKIGSSKNTGYAKINQSV